MAYIDTLERVSLVVKRLGVGMTQIKQKALLLSILERIEEETGDDMQELIDIVEAGGLSCVEGLNSIDMFFEAKIIEDSDCDTPRPELYARYRQYCESQGLPRYSRNKLNAKIKARYSAAMLIQIHGCRLWRGIKCNE